MSELRRIVNIDLTGPYSEGFTYQENLLPKYHAKLGFDTVMIATSYRWGKDGDLEYVGEADYVDESGVRIIRLEDDKARPCDKRFKKYSQLYGLLEELSPDIIFLHCCQIRDSKTIARYMESHDNCILYVDNHADYSNSAKNWLSKAILHRVIWRHYAQLLVPYARRFWGVLPARVDFLCENYGVPREKCDLLVMGADDAEVARVSTPDARVKVRSNLGFSEEDFLIVAGGKIDLAKTQILSLMEAVRRIDVKRVKLLVFGPIVEELQDRAADFIDGSRVKYISWASSSESFDYFASADLVAFPGRHSVYWEQAAALGKPMLLKCWDGTTHVDCGGNVRYTSGDDAPSLVCDLLDIIQNPSYFSKMNDAGKAASSRFLYSEIASRSIDFAVLNSDFSSISDSHGEM
ncbi:glycosyltransferase [uncultured Slackia sp.]|uniref:glycosyltransferase n=1 Tax=uncultured Slackia sp. TaxID=665903 RepID=UPI00260BE82D|nr:glycosyltransferase [uncultured Slackia sp.]